MARPAPLKEPGKNEPSRLTRAARQYDLLLLAVSAASLMAALAASRDAPARPAPPRTGAAPFAVAAPAVAADPAPGFAAPPERAADGRGTRIDINSAGADELMLLPGVGPVLAQRIIDFRQKNGPFRSPAELLMVSGIGPKKFSAAAAMIDAGPAEAPPAGR